MTSRASITKAAIRAVVATGDATYFGAMARDIVGARPLTSFELGVRAPVRIFRRMAAYAPSLRVVRFTKSFMSLPAAKLSMMALRIL